MANFMEIEEDKLRTVPSERFSRQSTASTLRALHPHRQQSASDVIDCALRLMDLEVEKATVANQHRADNLREHLYLSALRAEEIERAKREFIHANMPKYLRR